MTLTPQELSWLAARNEAVLVTIKQDGAPQTSNILYGLKDGIILVSVTDDRAKARNMRRDPRGVLHVVGASFWEFASVTVEAAWTDVSTTPGDEAGLALLEAYELITGKAPDDRDDYLEAMVKDKRLLLRLTPTKLVGLGLS